MSPVASDTQVTTNLGLHARLTVVHSRLQSTLHQKKKEEKNFVLFSSEDHSCLENEKIPVSKLEETNPMNDVESFSSNGSNERKGEIESKKDNSKNEECSSRSSGRRRTNGVDPKDSDIEHNDFSSVCVRREGGGGEGRGGEVGGGEEEEGGYGEGGDDQGASNHPVQETVRNCQACPQTSHGEGIDVSILSIQVM